MTSTVFTPRQTAIQASWLNDVNNFVYGGTLPSGGVPWPIAAGGTGATTAAGARAALGLAVGSTVQAWDADLDGLAALGTTGVISRTGAGTFAARTIAAGSTNITVSNGDGVAGAPSIDLSSSPSVSSLLVKGSSTGKTTLNSGLSGAGNNTLTLPTTASDTLAALGTVQSWSAAQTYPQSDLILKGSSTGGTTLNSGLSGAGNNTLSLPTTASDTLAALGTAQTYTAVQTFPQSDLVLKGSSTGKTTLNSGLSAGSDNTLTLPITSSDTIAALGTAQTWTADQTYGYQHLILQGTATGVALLFPDVAGSNTNAFHLPALGNGVSGTLATTENINTWGGIQSFNDTTLALKGATSGVTTLKANATSGTVNQTFQAVTGIVYCSGGSAVAVTDGGTGVATMTTAYAPVCAGTSATGALQVASTGLSTVNNVLTSTGSGSVPTFQTFAGLLLANTNMSGVSSSSVTVPSVAYTNLLIVYENVISSGGGTLELQISGASTGFATEIQTDVAGVVTSATSAITAAIDLSCSIGLGTTQATATSGYTYVTVTNASAYTQFNSHLVKSLSTTTADLLVSSGHWNGNAAASLSGVAIKLLPSAGTITGRWHIYALQ